jgi:parvulin-like peptidyl-prolyl isomerase
MPRLLVPVLAVLATLLLGCQGGAQAVGDAPSPGSAPAAAEVAADAELPGSGPTSTPSIAVSRSVEVANAADRIAARHILVSHEAAANRPMNVHRSAKAARDKADELRSRLLAGEDFAALAEAESDCSTRARGGFLGGFDRGTMDEAFDRVAFALTEGEISPVVETPFGFHIIERLSLAEVRVAQILVSFEGASRDKTERSREDALALAQQAARRVEAGEPFEAVAKDLSDGPSGLRGGDLGWFTRGQFLPAWEDVAFALEPGQTSEIFETSAGFHLLRRLE